MVGVEPLGAAQRQAHAVQRQRIVGAQRLQNGEPRSAGNHVVFRMDLEPSDIRLLAAYRFGVFALEPDAGAGGHPGSKDGGAG